MSKSKRKAAKSRREEEQAKKIFKIVIISLCVLALVMIIGFSLLGS